jgi:hypothetical protein
MALKTNTNDGNSNGMKIQVIINGSSHTLDIAQLVSVATNYDLVPTFLNF